MRSVCIFNILRTKRPPANLQIIFFCCYPNFFHSVAWPYTTTVLFFKLYNHRHLSHTSSVWFLWGFFLLKLCIASWMNKNENVNKVICKLLVSQTLNLLHDELHIYVFNVFHTKWTFFLSLFRSKTLKIMQKH